MKHEDIAVAMCAVHTQMIHKDDLDRLVKLLSELRAARETLAKLRDVASFMNDHGYAMTPCDHEWETKRWGGDPQESSSEDVYRVCRICGAQEA